MIRDRKAAGMWAAVFLLYVLSVWIHSLLLPGPRVLATYYDEWLYWGTAKNFWTEARFTLNHAPIEFYKFVYSLVLSPLFRIGDGVQRALWARRLNLIMISWSVFPAYRLVRKITPSRMLQIVCLILLLVSPIMNYAEKYAPENLYLPMGLYLLLGYFHLFEMIHREDMGIRRPAVWAGVLGLFAAVCYDAREAVAALIGGFLILTLAQTLRCARKREAAWKRYLAVTLAHAGAFAACLVLIGLALNLKFSYGHQVGIGNIDSLYKIEYLVYCLICNSLYICAAFFGFPLLYAVFRKRTGRSLAEEKGAPHRDWVFCLYIGFALMILSITYSISVREELGRRIIRNHTRYYLPFLLPFLAQTLEEIRTAVRNPAKTGLAAVLCMGLACVLLLSPSRYVAAYDSYDTWIFQDATGYFDDISEEKAPEKADGEEEPEDLGTRLKAFVKDQTAGKKEITFHHGLVFSMLAFTGITVLVFLLACRNRKAALAVCCCAVLLAEGYNDYATLRKLRSLTTLKETEMAGYIELDRDLHAAVGEENLLVISTKRGEAGKRKLETFLSGDWYATLTGDLKKLLDEEGILDLTKKQITPAIKSFVGIKKYPEGTAFPYVLCRKDVRFREESVDIVLTSKATGYTLYRMKDPTRLAFEYIKDVYDETDEEKAE